MAQANPWRLPQPKRYIVTADGANHSIFGSRYAAGTDIEANPNLAKSYVTKGYLKVKEPATKAKPNGSKVHHARSA